MSVPLDFGVEGAFFPVLLFSGFFFEDRGVLGGSAMVVSGPLEFGVDGIFLVLEDRGVLGGAAVVVSGVLSFSVCRSNAMDPPFRWEPGADFDWYGDVIISLLGFSGSGGNTGASPGVGVMLLVIVRFNDRLKVVPLGFCLGSYQHSAYDLAILQSAPTVIACSSVIVSRRLRNIHARRYL